MTYRYSVSAARGSFSAVERDGGAAPAPIGAAVGCEIICVNYAVESAKTRVMGEELDVLLTGEVPGVLHTSTADFEGGGYWHAFALVSHPI